MAMAFTYNSPPRVQLHRNPISLHAFPAILSFRSYQTATLLCPRICALRTGSDGERLRSQDTYGPSLIRKPVIQPVVQASDEPAKKFAEITDFDEDNGGRRRYREEEELVDWEDKILEDTVPLVGFVRMILHSGKYESGDRLSSEHEKTIIERLLHYHPEHEKKIGPGIDYITIGYHPEFEGSRCLFIVRKDGELVDFSYWKCIKGLIRKNYPLYADSFILRHFRRRGRT